MFGKSNLPYLLHAIYSHDSDDCLIWPHGTEKSGYGKIRFEGQDTRVHRAVFKITHGRWPEPCARHTCDCRSCFNPRHIIEGTQQDNMLDAYVRGRTVRGEKQGGSKLTKELVLKIRAEYVPYDANVGATALGLKYGVANQTISKIVNRKIWLHV
jgi:hypothetical protein